MELGPNPRSVNEDLSKVANGLKQEVVQHVHGLYTRVKMEVPIEWRGGKIHSIGVILAAIHPKLSKVIKNNYLKLDGVQKARYEANAIIKTTTSGKRYLMEPLFSFDDSCSPNLTIERDIELIYEELQRIENLIGLIAVEVHCVFMTCDKFDRRMYEDSDTDESDLYCDCMACN